MILTLRTYRNSIIQVTVQPTTIAHPLCEIYKLSKIILYTILKTKIHSRIMNHVKTNYYIMDILFYFINVER